MFERLCFVFKKSLLAFLFLGYSSVFAATDQEKLNFRFDTSKMDNCTFIPIYAIKPFGASINFDKGKVQKYRYEGVDFYRVFTNFRKPEEWAADRKQMYKDKYDFPMPKCMYKGVKVDKIAFCFSMMMGGRESTRKKDYMQSKMDKFCISGPDNLTDGNSFNYDEPNNGWTGADLEGDYYANELGFVDGGYHFHWGDKETHGHSLGKRGVKDKDVWTSRVVGQNYYPDKKAKCTVDKGWKSQLIPPDYGRGHKIWMKINRYIPCDYCAENDGIHTSERCCKGTQTNSNSGTSTNVWDSNNKKCCPKGQEWDTATNKCKNTLVCPTPKEGIAIPEGCSCGYGLYEKSGHCCPSYTDWNSSQKKCVSTCKTGPWKDVAFKVSTDMKSCLKEQERTREGCPFSVERTREISAADSDCWSGWGPCEKSKSNENYYQMRLCKSSTKGCWSSGGKKFTDIRECTPCSDSGKGGFGQSVKCDGTCKSGLVKSGDKCGCPSG
ncbi:MAG: hypothetical protein N4A44_00475, partial [Alphaproteobacteria bacterium]|nr:hypothetical protein [Alphaproteobacteria bacterium]